MAAKELKCQLWGGKKDGLLFGLKGRPPKFLLFSPEPEENVPEKMTKSPTIPYLCYQYHGRYQSTVYYCYLRRQE